MNQEQNQQSSNVTNSQNTIPNVDVSSGVNTTIPSTTSLPTTPLTPQTEQPVNTLVGSPGVIVAPVSNEPTDASSADKGRVNGVVRDATEVPQTLSQTTRINPTVVAPKVNVSSDSTVPPVTENVLPNQLAIPSKKSRKAKVVIILLILVIAVLGSYIYLDYTKDLARGECSPLVASDNTLRELDLNSSIVQELYDKVKTTIREDVAYHNFDDTFKLYLAYRQIPNSDIYDSHCHLFDNSSMSNFSCDDTLSFVPKAFKVETLEREVKKLFGENVTIDNQNIVLGNSCFGGFQYIPERGEYVQGYCGQVPTTTYNADKELISATVQGDTIILKENVRYYSAVGISGDQLQNGVYVHTFKLDNNYHYAYVDRTVEAA